jgi:tRNA A22 N-methylase
MSPLLELVVLAYCQDCSYNDRVRDNKLTSIADVGCDHGILSLSLASMAFVSSQSTKGGKENNIVGGSFISRVTGTDISHKALNGALMSWDKINESLSRKSKEDGDDNLSVESMHHSIALPIDFRVGAGLSPLQTGEADAIILAGMGVHTMIEILTGKNHLEKLETNYLFLQPTNSRPRHLLMLYDVLQNDGHRWVLMDESIVFVAGRWYVSSYFKRGHSDALQSTQFCYPGHFLKKKACVHSRSTYVSYVNHHINWLKRDYRSRREKLEREDERWIQYLCREEDGAYWRDAFEWYNIIHS